MGISQPAWRMESVGRAPKISKTLGLWAFVFNMPVCPCLVHGSMGLGEFCGVERHPAFFSALCIRNGNGMNVYRKFYRQN